MDRWKQPSGLEEPLSANIVRAIARGLESGQEFSEEYLDSCMLTLVHEDPTMFNRLPDLMDELVDWIQHEAHDHGCEPRDLPPACIAVAVNGWAEEYGVW